MLINVRDTNHADSLALFEINIEILLVDVTKPEKSNIPTLNLTCDVTGDPEVIKICFSLTVFPGLSNSAWILWIAPVVSEIRGELEIPSFPNWGAF